jgi:hypothetical protein
VADVRVDGWFTAGVRAVNGWGGCAGCCCGLGGSKAGDGQDESGGVLHGRCLLGLLMNCYFRRRYAIYAKAAGILRVLCYELLKVLG